MADQIRPTEIRIFLKGGAVEQIGIGRDVPTDMILSFVDEDVQGTAADAIEDNGYGERCVFSSFSGDAFDAKRDADGVLWL